MAEDFQDRTEPATPKRREESRAKGEIPRSRDLNTLVMLVGASSAILLWGGDWLAAWTDNTRATWSLAAHPALNSAQLLAALSGFINRLLLALGPFLGLLYCIALATPALLGGWTLSGKALTPRFSRLDPLAGIARLFSLRSLVELAKTLGKFALVCGGATAVFHGMRGEFLQLGGESTLPAIRHAGALLAWGMLLLSLSLVVVALLDVPYQLWEHSRKTRMSKQQVKDEHRQTEGDPLLKARIRQLQREIAQRRMMDQVPKADVIITNPEHYAVALQYDQARMAAPKVVAKGQQLLAQRIRSIALEHRVPIVRAPLLSRALYFTCEIEQAIPQGLFLAVAQVLAYVYRMERAWANRPAETGYPGELSIPEEFARAANRRRGQERASHE